MSEFGVAATLHVPDSEIDEARAAIEEGVADIPVSTSRTSSPALDAPSGGMGGVSLSSLAEERNETLLEILDTLEDGGAFGPGGSLSGGRGGGGGLGLGLGRTLGSIGLGTAGAGGSLLAGMAAFTFGGQEGAGGSQAGAGMGPSNPGITGPPQPGSGSVTGVDGAGALRDIQIQTGGVIDDLEAAAQLDVDPELIQELEQATAWPDPGPMVSDLEQALAVDVPELDQSFWPALESPAQGWWPDVPEPDTNWWPELPEPDQGFWSGLQGLVGGGQPQGGGSDGPADPTSGRGPRPSTGGAGLQPLKMTLDATIEDARTTDIDRKLKQFKRDLLNELKR